MHSIAEKRKVPLETLLKLNHDVSPDALVEGQRLQLPVGELSARDQEILVLDLFHLVALIKSVFLHSQASRMVRHRSSVAHWPQFFNLIEQLCLLSQTQDSSDRPVLQLVCPQAGIGPWTYRTYPGDTSASFQIPPVKSRRACFRHAD